MPEPHLSADEHLSLLILDWSCLVWFQSLLSFLTEKSLHKILFTNFILIKSYKWLHTVAGQESTDLFLVEEQERQGIGWAEDPPGLSWPGWCCPCCSSCSSLHPEPDNKKRGETHRDEGKLKWWKHILVPDKVKAPCWYHMFSAHHLHLLFQFHVGLLVGFRNWVQVVDG